MPSPQRSEDIVQPPSSDGNELDLHAYWRVVLRRRWVILSVFAAILILALLATLKMTKVYAASTTLIIDLNAPRVLNKEQVQDVVDSGVSNFLLSKEYYETQYKVITSRAVAQRVIEKLQLGRDRRFLNLEDVKDDKELGERVAKVDPTTELQERLTIIPVKDSRVVRIQIEDRDPKWAATIANAVAEAYITENLSVRSTTTQNASDWLEQQLADLETKLAKSADDLFTFKQAHDIVATSWEDRQSMVTQQLVAVNDALAKARVQKATLEARSEQFKALRKAMDEGNDEAQVFGLINQSRTAQDLKVRYFETRVECADLKARYLEGHPSIMACQQKLAAARDGLLREIRSILDAATKDYEEVVETEHKLQRLFNRTKADAFSVNQYEKEYLELKRTHDNNQRLYEMVLQRLKETGVTGMMQLSNVRILDRAEPPERPTRPKPLRNMALAIVLGVLGGVGLAFLLEALDTSLTTREQIEERLGLPFLGVIPSIDAPKSDKERDLFVHANPRSAAAECLRSIRTNLLFMSPEKPLRTIVITSASPSEGKTTTATALAEVMADGGSRVLLVDADMRRPQLHRVFDTPNEAGLSSLILGEGTLEGVVRATQIPNLSVLPCGPIPPNPTELLHTKAFSMLVAEAAARYDRVIIDSPPAGVVADSIVTATQVDGTLLVIKAGQTSRDSGIRTVRALRDVNAPILGAVLNHLDLTQDRYAGSYYGGQYYSAEESPADASAR